MKTNDFAYQLSRYFTVYLSGQRNLSSNTIASYRDTFSKLLQFFSEQGVAPEKLNFGHITRDKIEDFLTWLESSQGCGAATRNHRLSGVKSFFRYVQIVCPDQLFLCSAIINDIHIKKFPKPAISYLSKNGIKLLLAQPDTNNFYGRRDLAMLSMLYDTAARVQELCDLTVQNLRLDTPATVTLTGKGRKSRYVPLSAPNAAILRKYLKERGLDCQEHRHDALFTNHQGGKLTRGGVSYILRKYVLAANLSEPNTLPESLTPHCLRHSKAMHMLEAGNNLIYIRDFLGHEDMGTTQVYAKANPETKRAVLEKVYADDSTPELPDWNADPSLMSFLKGLGM
jgi:site-specific recombinase XerD